MLKVDEVLSMECEKELEEGRNPGPLVEIEFWEAKCRNLESLYEQMKNSTTRNMASILNVTDSAYYPCFKYSSNYFKNRISEELRQYFPINLKVDYAELNKL